jgi:hypothetical protein
MWQAADMSVSMLVFTILGSCVAALCALAGGARWAYNRGYTAGKREAGLDAAKARDRAKIDTLERQLAETQAQLAELAAVQAKRRR